jgi:exosortase/archaeosortase
VKDRNTRDIQKYLASTVWLCDKCLIACILVKLFLFITDILNVLLLFYLTCMCILFAYMSLHHLLAWGSRMLEECVGLLGSRVTDLVRCDMNTGN